MKPRSWTGLILLSSFLIVNRAAAQGTVFTYQGQLLDGGQPANGTNYGMVFYLYDAATNGTQLGNFGIPSVTVSNGLFTVPLDFGTNFTGANRWLEITVQKNGGGFSTLNPRQSLTPAPYAIFAETSGGVTNGAITAASIAPGSINGTLIQAGSITSNLFAPGSVNVSALRSPYQSGRIDLSTLTPPSYFSAATVTQAVVFPQSFASAPTVTTGLETGLKNAATVIPPLLVSGKTTSGFSVSFTLQDIPVPVAAGASSYFGSWFPTAMVNGRPAIAYNGPGGLDFIRAQDAIGQRWGNGVFVNVQSRAFDLMVVGGKPALALIDGVNLDFVQANDADGTSWPLPTVIKTGNATFQPQGVSLAVVSGFPAIACWSSASISILYFRANDTNGAGWPTNGVFVATGNNDFDLAQVSNNPAVAYGWDNGLAVNNSSHQAEIRFIRSTDTNGNSWPASAITITNGGVLESYASPRMLIVATNPAIAFVHGLNLSFAPQYDVRFIRSGNSQGSVWGGSVLVTSSFTGVNSLNATLVNGNVALGWFDNQWMYAESSNNGVSYSYYPVGSYYVPGALIDVGGKPAFTLLYLGAGTELLFLRDSNPVPDTFINWIAVQP